MEWNRLLSADRQRKSIASEYDLRSEFQKDYHRIIGSASFRRLQDKTQVFPLDKSDFVRTRLTHSLEVSSLAKSLGQSVTFKLHKYRTNNGLTEDQMSDIVDILLCAGLIHDIGNPPFGHFGEIVIQEWFKTSLCKLTYKGETLDTILEDSMKNDLMSFEGNAQALRVISKLHNLVDSNGMNLTKGLCNTLIKYPIASNDPKNDSILTKKFGYFYSEKEIYENIVKSTDAVNKRHPLTYILEAADDIAYKTADVEDGAKKGLLTYNTILQELAKVSADENISDDLKKYLNESLIDLETSLDRSKGKTNPELNAIQNWIIKVQGKLMNAASYSFTKNYDVIMTGEYPYDLFKDTHAEALVNALGDIAFLYIFKSKEIEKIELSASKIINFFLDNFIDAVINYDTDVPCNKIQKKYLNMISDNYKDIYHEYSQNKEDFEKLYLRLLMVTDFITGMTDNYAKTLYQELNGLI